MYTKSICFKKDYGNKTYIEFKIDGDQVRRIIMINDDIVSISKLNFNGNFKDIDENNIQEVTERLITFFAGV